MLAWFYTDKMFTSDKTIDNLISMIYMYLNWNSLDKFAMYLNWNSLDKFAMYLNWNSLDKFAMYLNWNSLDTFAIWSLWSICTVTITTLKQHNQIFILNIVYEVNTN